ncbi:SC5D [Symbiodinium microadriaticum]|nr:SC5D [Symbiodinium microadriaticum]
MALLVLLRDAGQSRNGLLGALFMLGAICFAITSAPQFNETTIALRLPLMIFSELIILFFWMFGRALFDDEYRIGWLEPLIAIVQLTAVFVWIITPADQLVFVKKAEYLINNGIELLLVGHVVWLAYRGREDDLIAERRRARLRFITVVAFMAVIVLSVKFVIQPQSDLPPWLSLVNMGGLLLVSSFVLIRFVSLRRDDIAGVLIPPAPMLETDDTPRYDPHSQKIITDLTQAMDVDAVWKDEELSIGALADRLGVQEHILRRLINQELGHRNFSAFLGTYRLAEAEKMLADRRQAHIPILTIAHRVGFGSIGTFNRAFKERTGMTPRRQVVDLSIISDFFSFFGPFVSNFPTQYAAHIGGYFLAASLFAALIWGFRPATLIARKIQDRVTSSDDIRREIKYSLLTVTIFGLTGIIGYTGHNLGWTQLYLDVDQYGLLWLPVSLAIKLVAHDTWFYWTHRAMHTRKLFRRTHWTHHKSKVPTPYTALSFDPPEAFSHALFGNLFIFLVPMHPIVGIIFFGIMITRNVMGHTGHELHPKGWLDGPFRWINATTHHDLHHQNGNYNFGLYFTWWDKLMGTEHPDYKARFDAVTANGGSGLQVARYPLRAAGLVVIAMIGMFTVSQAVAEPAPMADKAMGQWISVDETMIISIEPCPSNAERMCGRVVWHIENKPEDGKPLLDRFNPDPKLRSQPVVGMTIGRDFLINEAKQEAKGKIYSPDDGGIYRSTIRFGKTLNDLELEGCVFIFCRVEKLKRVDGPQEAAIASAEKQG